MRSPQIIPASLLLAAALLASGGVQADVQRQEVGNLVLENVPEIPAAVRENYGRYLEGRAASVADWTHDGRLLITTRFGDVAQLHVVDQPLGARRQITFFKEPIGGASAPRTSARPGFVFPKDVGGDENYQLYYQGLAEGVPVRLTDGRGRASGGTWSNAGTQVAFGWTARTGADTDIYVDDPRDRMAPQLVFEAQGGGWNVTDWSPDDRQLLISNYVSASESHLYLLDIETRKITELDVAKEKVSRGNALFSADGKGVYFTSDRGSEFQVLRHLDLATGKDTTITGSIRWDVESFDLSRDGRYLAYVINEEGASRLYVSDLREGADLAVPTLPYGLIGGLAFDANSGRLAFSLTSSRSPADAYVLDLASLKLTQWTQSETGPVDTRRFVEPTLVRYPTFDTVKVKAKGKPQRREIPAWVYKPAGAGPHPVIIDIHGGPEGQSRPGYNTGLQYVVAELGYAYVLPNVRGSEGYGKGYLELDNGFLREDSVKDIGALLDWIATQPDLDKNRVVVFGGSYGGYMTLASMVHYNDRLAGGIDVVGISNFVTFLTNTADYRRDLRRVEYGDERDPKMRAFQERIAPLNNAQKITKPMLIVQGRNDPRVPVTEAEQMVAKIRANGGDVWYLMAKDEGHGFRKKQNRDFYLWTVAMFLERLKKQP